MTDPQQFAADNIAGMAESVKGQPVSEQELAEGAVSSGIGTTEVDVAALAAQIQAMQVQMDQMAAAAAASAPPSPVLGTVQSLQGFLASHGDPLAVELGNDLAEAAGHAVDSGDPAYAAKIHAKLARHLTRNGPVPGENYAYKQAVAFLADLEDLLDAVVPPPSGAPALASAGGAPVKVIAGSVTG